MKTLVIGSIRKSAGKTSLIAGLARAAGGACGYLKPFGDRLLYKKKRLWDYDAALMSQLLALKDDPEKITLGFEHAKLKYMYTPAALIDKLAEVKQATIDHGYDRLFVEGGRDITYGLSRGLDSLSVARQFGGRLVLVVRGEEGAIIDDIQFVKRSVDLSGIDLAGLIINKVQDPEEFLAIYQDELDAAGLPVLGVIPFKRELTTMSLGFLAEALFAKVVAGEANLERPISRILVGAMSTDQVLRLPDFQHKDKLVITSGDRSDMVLAALDSGSAGIIITNNILPPANIIARAAQTGTPLLQVSADTYQVAKQIDDYDALLTRGDDAKLALLEAMVKEHLDIDTLLG